MHFNGNTRGIIGNIEGDTLRVTVNGQFGFLRIDQHLT